MREKFTEEFQKITEGGFPMLKYKSATYVKATGELTVRFLISAYDSRSFGDDMKKKVDEALEKMFHGVGAHAEYISEFFNLHNQMVFRRLRPENVMVSIDGDEIRVVLAFETPTYKLLLAADTARELKDFLDGEFNPEISVSLKETECEHVPLDGTAIADTVVVRTDTVRLIHVETGEKVYARGKVAGISQMPSYISDVKGALDNVVLCGRITGVNKRTYKNRKFTPDDPKNGPEELPLVRFFLDDTTGRMECVCFPRPEEAEAFDALAEKDEIICAGKVSLSSYNGVLSYAVNALFRAKIDFSSVKAAASKPAPAKYTVLKPVPYTEPATAASLFEEPSEKPVPEFFKGKTFVVFDFEATGLDIATIEPIEIGALKVKDGKVTETFGSLLDPGCHIPEQVAEKTHITDKMVAGMPAFTDVLPDFFKFTRGAVLVGHNISGYDFPLLAKYADKAGYIFDNELEDTVILARKYLPEMRHVGLEALTKALGITHIEAHRAMGDVFATLEVLRVIAARM